MTTMTEATTHTLDEPGNWPVPALVVVATGRPAIRSGSEEPVRRRVA